MIARVHSFESFGTVDGPGIRFVIFFQGCMLKCKYCHNRDMWGLKGGQTFSPDALLAEVVKYKPYFQHTGGGVTVSGGEPLMQAMFLAEFFRRCKDEGISTVLDTSGCVALTQDVQRTLAHTDLVLLDIKQIDSVRHEALTGMSNEYTLAMARYLSDNKIPMRVRYVVVPGYTDAAEDVARLADFLKEMRNLERVELLPYHMLGKHKWEMMGVPYELNGVPTPSSAQMTAIASAFASRGIAASHGQ